MKDCFIVTALEWEESYRVVLYEGDDKDEAIRIILETELEDAKIYKEVRR